MLAELLLALTQALTLLLAPGLCTVMEEQDETNQPELSFVCSFALYVRTDVGCLYLPSH